MCDTLTMTVAVMILAAPQYAAEGALPMHAGSLLAVETLHEEQISGCLTLHELSVRRWQITPDEEATPAESGEYAQT
jgi:hypothetical protein